jgi:hypothetical protein
MSDGSINIIMYYCDFYQKEKAFFYRRYFLLKLFFFFVKFLDEPSPINEA